jgi:DHA2 family multidrug resistance protein-like MFS transporter
MTYGLKRIAERGLGWLPLVFVVAGLATGASFLRRQRRLAHPLIDLAPFRFPAFRSALVTYMFATFAVFGTYLFIAQFLQLVVGLSPLQAGLWTLPFTGGFVVGSLLTPLIVRRFRPASVIAVGLAVSAVGFAVLAQVDEASGLGVLVCATVVFSLSLAPVFTLANDTVIGTAPPERAGSASAISETCSELGGALGIAVLGSIGAALYRGAMVDAVPPGVSLEAAEAARGTLGSALALASQLPGPLGAALLGTARRAFTQGLQLTAVISAATVVAAAILATVTLSRARPDRS